MTNGRTVDEIVASVETAQSELGKLERELQEEIDEIRISAARAGRSLSPEELQRLKELRAEKAEARGVLTDLVFFKRYAATAAKIADALAKATDKLASLAAAGSPIG
jgi:hypothetical protein